MLTRLCRPLWLFGLVLFPAFAQTSGATAPEVAQFEPVDITDLVNLATGDFQYALPVGSLPGAPGGTFPLSLNYKAGVRLAQEASWVGLGWNLQPGSISRAVRAYPDDYLAAPIYTTERLRSTYSYSVGIGFQGANVGVNWDNHGGFGGQVGVSLGNSLSASYATNNQGRSSLTVGFSAGLGGYAGGSFTMGSDGSGFSGRFGGVSLNSAGTLGVSVGASSNAGGGGSIQVSNRQYSPYMSRTSGGSGSMMGISLGVYKTSAYRRAFSHAYGYLHMDRVGRNIPVTYEPTLSGADQNTVIAGEVAALASGLQKAQGLLAQSDLDRTYTDRLGNNISYDTYYQDYSSSDIAPYEDNDERDALNQAKAFNADYLSGSFDLYSVAAPGISGLAKPVYRKRGLLLPPENTKTLVNDTGFFYFHPYRNLMYALEQGDLNNWPQVIRDYFKEDDWAHFAEKDFAGMDQDNMVMLNDPGLAEDREPFDLSSPNSDRYRRWRYYRRHNQSQRIRYHLDDKGQIESISVVKNDGVRYVFGVLRDRYGMITAGAAPRNYGEERHSRMSKSLGPGTPESKSVERLDQSYAYAWYLAAVTSPDFTDREPIGHYGPEDLGDYATFHYGIGNPGFAWLNPFPSQGEPGDGEPDFNFTGRSRTDSHYFYERSLGSKDLYFPLYAKTRTHMAMFDYSAERTDNRGGFWDTSLTPAAVVEKTIYRFRPGHYQELDSDLRDENGNPHPLIAQIQAYAAGQVTMSEGRLFLFQAGTAHLLGLDEIGQSMPVTVSNGTQPVMRYLGTIGYGHADIFFINRCDLLGGSPCSFASITADVAATRPNQKNGSVKLDRIRFYERNSLLNPMFATAYTNQITPRTFTNLHQDYRYKTLSSTQFSYEYDLGHMVPNSATGGRLSLTRVQFAGANGFSMGNPYEFSYYVDKTSATHPTGYRAAYYQKDAWGFPSPESSRYQSIVSQRTFTQDGVTVPIQANFSLKTILTPVGTELNLQYESDRFSRAQDRLAINARTTPTNAAELGTTPTEGMLVHLEGPQLEALVGTTAQPRSYAQVRESLTNLALDWSQGGNRHRDQVIVFARGTSFNEDCIWLNEAGDCQGPSINHPSPNLHRFVVPLDVSGSPTLAAAHPSLDEVARWLVTETTHSQGQVAVLAVWAMPTQNGAPVAFEFGSMSNPQLSVGELGGGLRVAQLKTAPRYWPGGGAQPPPEQVRILRYNYAGSDGLDSGTIFSDPIGYRFGFGGDQRLINSEAHPYFNMPGSEINYGEVTVTTLDNSGRALGGATRYRFITAGDARVVKPFNCANASDPHYGSYRQNVTTFALGNAFWWRTPSTEQTDFYNLQPANAGVSVTHQVNPVFRWKLRKNLEAQLDRDNPFELAGHNEEFPVGFNLRYQADSLVLNNSGLIGQLQETATLDDSGALVQETRYEYRESYPTQGDGPLVARFTRQSDGRLAPTVPQPALSGAAGTEVGYNAPATPFSRTLAQGTHTEKSQSLMIRRADGNGYLYEVGVRAQDEVWNNFRRHRTITRNHQPVGDRNHVVQFQQEELAYDYTTGSAMLLETQSVNGDGSPLYDYTWSLPAHEIWDGDGQQGMKTRNLLLQPGYQLHARSRTRLHQDLDRDWLTRLAGNDVQVVTASVKHWRNNALPTRPSAWLEDATMSFIHTNTDNSSNGWAVVPNERDQGFLKDTQYILSGSAADGKWEIAGQNTAWNDKGQVLEHRDRLGNFTSAVYDPGGTFLIANFTNARGDEVYYENFENWAVNPTGTYPPARQLTPGMQLSRSSDASSYQIPEESHDIAMTYAYSGLFAAKGRIEFQFVPGEGRSEDQEPTNTVDYMLRFYAKAGLNNQTNYVSINGRSIELQPTQPASSADLLWITPVEDNWYLVQLVLPNVYSPLVIDTARTATLIDDIALYPYNNGAPHLARSSVAHYSYDPQTRKLASMTDARGRTMRYVYNRRGDLIQVIDTEGRVIKKHHRFDYKATE